jgi:hypothetical protein
MAGRNLHDRRIISNTLSDIATRGTQSRKEPVDELKFAHCRRPA